MLDLYYTNKFKKDYKLMEKRGYKMELLDNIIRKLSKEEQLPKENLDHCLQGNYKGYKECHIQPNWLLIYKIDKKELILTAFRTGSHSDLLE